jgi:uncharacterized membrane protein
MSTSRIPTILRKAIVTAVAARQAYLLSVVGLLGAVVGLALAIRNGEVAQALALTAGIIVVLGALTVAVVVERRRARQAAVEELERLDEWSAKRKILAHG